MQAYVLTKLFCQARSTKRKMSLFLQLTLPACLTFLLSVLIERFIYPAYNKQDSEGKLLIAVFAPLTAALVKPISRICVQRLYNITYPGYSYVLLTPLYCGAAAIVSVNGVLYLYQFIYTENNSYVNLLQSFAINTSVPLIIEWFLTAYLWQ